MLHRHARGGGDHGDGFGQLTPGADGDMAVVVQVRAKHRVRLVVGRRVRRR